MFNCLVVLVLLQTIPQSSTIANDNSVVASSAKSQLQNSVRRLNAWINNSQDAPAWRRYLLLNYLETQTAKGDQADIQTLSLIRDRFAQDNKALKHPAFNDVRLALEAQIKRLGSKTTGDLKYAIDQAQGMFKPTTAGQIGYHRDLAVYELQLLKKYYRASLPSRKRANIFYDLELDRAIEFLENIKFELPPEVSTGKLTSMMRDVQEQLDKVEEQLDALPITPEPDDEREEDDTPSPIESNIGNQLPLGPIPDSGEKSKKDLEREKKVITARLDVLKKQRATIKAADKPRSDARNKTFRRLLELESNFVDLSKEQTDPYFVSSAMSFEQFVRTYFYGTEDNLQEDYLRKIRSISENLNEIATGDSRSEFGKLGENLRWLENANQVPGLVASIRARYSNPNLYVGISGRLINQLGSQNVSTVQALRETMGGQLIRGTAQINANVNVELQNDPNQVHANLRLTGNLASSIYLQRRSLQVFTGANGQLEAARAIYANIGGLFSSDPQIAANISAYLSGTSSKLRIVNKIAADTFAKLKAETEGQTALTAEEQLKDQFSTQTDDVLKQGEKGLREAQDALNAKANLAPQIYLRSTNTQVVAVGKKSSISTLAAPDYPAVSTIPTDIGLRVHESLLSNFLDKTFSGVTLTDKELAKELGELLGGDELQAFTPTEEEEGEDNSFSITFDQIRPIQFEFDDNGFGVSIAGRRFAQGDRKINTGLRIGLRFKIKRVEGKLKFVRDGKATIDYVGKKSATAVTFRSVLEGRLNPKEGGQVIEVDLPNNLLPIDQIEQLKDNDIAKRLMLVQCRSENGWLYLGWNYQPENSYFQSQIDTPAIWTEATISSFAPAYTESTEIAPANPIGSTPDSTMPPMPAGAVMNNVPGPAVQNVPSIIQGQLQKN